MQNLAVTALRISTDKSDSSRLYRLRM